MENSRYFSRSWALLTRDKGWMKPLLVMAAATLVPIAGPLGNRGFALEWARLTAWGADAAPKQKNVDVAACIASGFRGFVVLVGWGLAYSMATGAAGAVAASLPGFWGDFLSGVISFITLVAAIFYGVVVNIAQVRAAIYESVGAGYRVDRVIELIKRDFEGFCKVCAMNVACGFVLGLVIGVFVVALVVPLIPVFVAAAEGYVGAEALTTLSGVIVWVVLIAVVFGYIISFLANMIRMLVINAVGLWLRQFNVPGWGRSGDPVPNNPRPYVQTGAGYAPPAQRAPYQEAQPQLGSAQATTPQPLPASPAPQEQEEDALVEAIPLVSVTPTPEEPLGDDESLRDVVAIPLDGEQVDSELEDETMVASESEGDAQDAVDDLYDGFAEVIKQSDRVPEDDED